MDSHSRQDPLAPARDLGPAIAAASDAIEKARRIPEPLLSQLHDSRLFRMLLPRSVGGEEAEPGTCLCVIEEFGRHDASVGWNVFVANSSSLIAPFLEPESRATIFADPRTRRRLGPAQRHARIAVAGGYRVTRPVGFRQRLPARQLDGRALPRSRDRRLAASQSLRPAGDPHAPVSRRAGDAARHLEHHRPARHRVRQLQLRRTCSCPRPFSSTREEPELRREPGPLYAFTMQGLYAVGVAGVALGIARAMLDEFIALAIRKTPRTLSRLADNAVVQADVAQAEARLGSARAYLLDTLASIYAQADDIEPIGIAGRARVRLACTNAIHGAIEVADYTYKAAGVDAIFPGSPFERRFRDIHTLSQQIQSRTAHFEAVGQVLLGMPPEVFF